jgi:hypothetical protein
MLRTLNTSSAEEIAADVLISAIFKLPIRREDTANTSMGSRVVLILEMSYF